MRRLESCTLPGTPCKRGGGEIMCETDSMVFMALLIIAIRQRHSIVTILKQDILFQHILFHSLAKYRKTEKKSNGSFPLPLYNPVLRLTLGILQQLHLADICAEAIHKMYIFSWMTKWRCTFVWTVEGIRLPVWSGTKVAEEDIPPPKPAQKSVIAIRLYQATLLGLGLHRSQLEKRWFCSMYLLVFFCFHFGSAEVHYFMSAFWTQKAI